MKNDRALADLLEALDRELEARQQACRRPAPAATGSSLRTASNDRPSAKAWFDIPPGAAAPAG